jgi:hypothetical protein
MSDDLVEDIKNDPEILNKVRNSNSYAQNLYCAFCNMRWCPREMFPALRQDPVKDLWSASWRGSGGIIAKLRGKGDYMDWYCSGIKGGLSYDTKDDDEYFEKKGYVSEGFVTDEIREDLARIGWFPVPWEDDNTI